MRTVKMTAKKSGTCTDCGGSITVGQSIYWRRGAGARHVDCKGSGDRRPNYSGHAPDVDLLYEDQCRDRCGL